MKLLILLIGLPFAMSAQNKIPFDDLWNYQQPAETETKFRTLLQANKKEEDPDYHLCLLTQIARTLSLQRKFTEAHTLLDSVDKELTAATPIAKIRSHLERGRTFNSNKEVSKALPLFTEAYALALKANDEPLAIDAAHMVAIAESAAEKQLEWNQIALKIAESSSHPKARRWLGSLYNNIGWTLHDQGKYEEALTIFQAALKFRESENTPETIRIAKWTVARTLRSLKRYEDALSIQLALAQEFKSLPRPDGYVFEELAELYLALNKTAEARYHFHLAFQELSQDEWLKANEAPRLERLKNLAGIQ